MIRFVIDTYRMLDETETTPIRNALRCVRWNKSPKKPWEAYAPTFRTLLSITERAEKVGIFLFRLREYNVMEQLLTVPNRARMFQ